MKHVLFAFFVMAGMLVVEQELADAKKGSVSVLYAGSLVNLMEKELGPAFSRVTGTAT